MKIIKPYLVTSFSFTYMILICFLNILKGFYENFKKIKVTYKVTKTIKQY